MADELSKEEKTMKVKTLSKTHIKPRKPIGRRECQLITFDLPYVAFYYNQKLLIYKKLVPYDGILNLEGLHRPLLGVQVTPSSCVHVLFFAPKVYDLQ
ncbi:hypothetical protein U1Q18_004538 [Sarracenia purpurea var. burkii]